MFKKFYPTVYADSAHTVDFSEYVKNGYKAVILDVDNTVVGHGAPADERAVLFFKKLRDLGLKTCILSNNGEERVKNFAESVGSDYIFHAAKPSVRGYEAAMKKCGSDKGNSLFIGDQLFTDIYGANKAGIKSILVKPVGPDWEFQILLKRAAEKIVMPFYLRYERKRKNNV